MRTILSIDHTQKRTAKDGRKYALTYATLDDGGEAEGFGLSFKPGDKVEVFFHYGKIKMRKSDWDTEPDPIPDND